MFLCTAWLLVYSGVVADSSVVTVLMVPTVLVLIELGNIGKLLCFVLGFFGLLMNLILFLTLFSVSLVYYI